MPLDQEHIKNLVLYRLETSAENIRSAKLLLGAGMYRDSNNRAYYAIFHSIQAVHAMDGHEYRRHKDALGNFNKAYVKTYIFPREIGKRIADAEIIRHASDYDDFFIASKSETEAQIKTAEDLLEMVRAYCESRKYGEEE